MNIGLGVCKWDLQKCESELQIRQVGFTETGNSITEDNRIRTSREYKT